MRKHIEMSKELLALEEKALNSDNDADWSNYQRAMLEEAPYVLDSFLKMWKMMEDIGGMYRNGEWFFVYFNANGTREYMYLDEWLDRRKKAAQELSDTKKLKELLLEALLLNEQQDYRHFANIHRATFDQRLRLLKEQAMPFIQGVDVIWQKEGYLYSEDGAKNNE